MKSFSNSVSGLPTSAVSEAGDDHRRIPRGVEIPRASRRHRAIRRNPTTTMLSTTLRSWRNVAGPLETQQLATRGRRHAAYLLAVPAEN